MLSAALKALKRAPAITGRASARRIRPHLTQTVAHHVACGTLAVVRSRFGSLVKMLPGGFRAVSSAVDEHAEDVLDEALASAGASLVGQDELRVLRAMAQAVMTEKPSRAKTLAAKWVASRDDARDGTSSC